jgi:uncharacterized coiled-coil protein SlyX
MVRKGLGKWVQNRLSDAQKLVWWDILRELHPTFVKEDMTVRAAVGMINDRLKARGENFTINNNNLKWALGFGRKTKPVVEPWPAVLGNPENDAVPGEGETPATIALAGRIDQLHDHVNDQLSRIRDLVTDATARMESLPAPPPGQAIAATMARIENIETTLAASLEDVKAGVTKNSSAIRRLDTEVGVLAAQYAPESNRMVELEKKVRDGEEAVMALVQGELAEMRKMVFGIQAQLGYLAADVAKSKAESPAHDAGKARQSPG